MQNQNQTKESQSSYIDQKEIDQEDHALEAAYESQLFSGKESQISDIKKNEKRNFISNDSYDEDGFQQEDDADVKHFELKKKRVIKQLVKQKRDYQRKPAITELALRNNNNRHQETINFFNMTKKAMENKQQIRQFQQQQQQAAAQNLMNPEDNYQILKLGAENIRRTPSESTNTSRQQPYRKIIIENVEFDNESKNENKNQQEIQQYQQWQQQIDQVQQQLSLIQNLIFQRDPKKKEEQISTEFQKGAQEERMMRSGFQQNNKPQPYSNNRNNNNNNNPSGFTTAKQLYQQQQQEQEDFGGNNQHQQHNFPLDEMLAPLLNNKSATTSTRVNDQNILQCIEQQKGYEDFKQISRLDEISIWKGLPKANNNAKNDYNEGRPPVIAYVKFTMPLTLNHKTGVFQSGAFRLSEGITQRLCQSLVTYGIDKPANNY